jgi:hypothetical protein
LKSPNDYLKKLPKPRPDLLFSKTWTQARFDIDNISDVLDIKSGLFLPWDASRPDCGIIRCYAIRLPCLHLVEKYFLAAFNTGLASVGFSRFDPKNLRQFQDAFPIFGPDDVENYLDWHNRVVLHGLTFGVFVPPVHTLRDGQPLGTWFSSLPFHVQSDAINHFAFLLTGCIRSKLHSLLRQECPEIYSTIQGHKADGYLLLYDLALHAGHHPHLRHHGHFSYEPSQHADVTLTAYINAWLQFAQHQLLDGTIYSDRFFHQQILYRMHQTVCSRLGPYLHQTVLQV